MAKKVWLAFNAYPVVMEGLQDAVLLGIHRANKHADDDPLTEAQRDRVAFHVEAEVASYLSRIVNWEQSGVAGR